MSDLGEKLKKARKAKGLTQEVVAEQVGVSRQTMSNWENGRSLPDIMSIISLSDIYGISLDAMLKGDKEIMKHLKDSTDVVKSSKQLTASIVLAGVFFVVFVLVRIFVPIPRFGGIIPNMIAVLVFVAGLCSALAGTVNIKKLSEGKTSNKKLLKIGFIALYAILYILMILFIPEALSSVFHVEAGWLHAVIRAVTAVVLLFPGVITISKFRHLFTEK